MKRPQFIVAALVLGAGAVFVLGFGGFGFARDSTPIEIPLEQFPREIAGWVGTDDPLDQAALDFIRPDDYLRRRYRRDGKMVDLFITYHGNKLEGLKRIHHNPTICMPAHGAVEEKSLGRKEAVTFTDIAKSVPLSNHYFIARDGSRASVTVFFSIDGILENVHRRPKQEPLERLLSRTMEAFEGPGYCFQVQVWAFAAGDPAEAYDLTVEFLRDTIARILQHFPARIEHE
jgi:EpsI family protein